MTILGASCLLALFHWLDMPWWFGAMAYATLAEALVLWIIAEVKRNGN